MSAWLAAWYGPLLWTLGACWLAAAPAAFKRLTRRLDDAPSGTAAKLVAVTALALAARLWLVESGHRVYFDEFEHLDIARALAAGAGFVETLAGGLASWDAKSLPTWPGAHHAGLALALKLAGPSAAVAFAWSALLSTASVPLVFWAALELFDDAAASLLAALLWALCPISLAYAGACDLTSSSLFWSAAALAGLAAARRDPACAAFGAFAAALAAQTRFENALLPLATVWALPRARRAWALPGLALLAIPAGLALTNARLGLPGFASGAAGGAAGNALRHLGPDLVFLLSPARAWAPAACLGLVACVRRREARGLALLAGAYLLAYASFFRGDFSRGTEDRYAASVLLPLAIAAAAAPPALRGAAALLTVGLALMRPLPGLPPEHEAMRRFAVEAGALVPADAVVLAFNPPFAAETLHRPVAAAQLALEDLPRLEAERARAGARPELYLLKDKAFRMSGEAGPRLMRLLETGYRAEVVAATGEDALLRLSPALHAPR